LTCLPEPEILRTGLRTATSTDLPPLTQGGVATLRELRGARAFAGLAVLGAAFVLLGAGCGDDESGPGEKPGEGVTLRIAVNPWTGSAVNANVAKILLERQLG
jgi:hypothetical protein